MRIYLYNVYDGNKKVLSNVQAKEVCALTGLPENSNLQYYFKNNALIKGKWRIEKSEETVVVSQPKSENKNYLSSRFTDQMLAEWREMNRRYGRRCSTCSQ